MSSGRPATIATTFSGATATVTSPAPTRRAWHADASADDQHAAEVALVRSTRPARQCECDLALRDALQTWREFGGRGDWNLEIIEENIAGMLGTTADEKTGLQCDESHRAVGLHGDSSERHAGITVEPGGYIECEDRPTGSVDRADDRSKLGAHRCFQSRAEQRIDDHVAITETLTREGLHLAAARHVVAVRLAGIPAQAPRRHCGEHRHAKPGRLRKACEHVAVPAVVAAAADDHRAVARRPASAQKAQRSLARALHQCVSRDVQLPDGIGIEGTHLRGGVQRDGQRHWVIILSWYERLEGL